MLHRKNLVEIAQRFLRLGFIAYGGPAAHIAMMEEEFVRRRAWLTRERFLDLLGAVNLLPGPSSTELAIYLGEIRGGLAGMIIAGACFILPAAILVIALAWIYVTFGSVPQIAALLFGIKPVVVALIAQAIWNLARSALQNMPLGLLAVTVVILAFCGVPVLILLVGSGALCMTIRGTTAIERDKTTLAVFASAETFASTTLPTVGLAPLFFYFLKIGAALFGSGYVLLAVLQADLVGKLHWLTTNQLLDAIAVSQATPGPFFTVATFVGYILAGWRGAVLGTVGMFFPAFVYVGATAGFLPRLRRSALAGAFLDGVNAAAVALIAFVGWQFARGVLVNLPAIILAAVGTLLVFRYKLYSAWAILGGAVAGILLRLVRLA